MADRYYNLMPQTPENNRIRKALEVYDLKRNTSEPTYYLQHTVPTGVNKIKGGMCNCGHNNRLLDRPVRQVLEGGSLPGYITADDMDARGKSRRPPGGVVDTKMTGKLVSPGTMVRYPGYNMNEQRRLDMEGGSFLGSLVSGATKLGQGAINAAGTIGKIGLQYGPGIIQVGMDIANNPAVISLVSNPDFQKLGVDAMAEALRRMSGGKLVKVKFEDMKGGSIFSGISTAISAGSRAAAAAAAAAAQAASQAASQAAALALKYGPAVLSAGMEIANSPITAQIVNSPQFGQLSEAALAEAMRRFSGSGYPMAANQCNNQYAMAAPNQYAMAAPNQYAMASNQYAGEPSYAAMMPGTARKMGSGRKKGGFVMSAQAARAQQAAIAAAISAQQNGPARHSMVMPSIPIQHIAASRPPMPPPSHLRDLLEKRGDHSKIDIDRLVEDYTRDYARMNGGAMGTYFEASAAEMRKKLHGSGDYPALEKAMKGKGKGKGYGSELDKLLKEAHSTTMRKMKGSGRGSERAQIVKSVMKEQGLSLPMASKYVKEHNLY